MPFCAKCGSSLEPGTACCPRCGTPVTSSISGGSPASGAMTSNVAAALSYVLGLFTGIIFLVLEPYKNDRFVRFHAYQSIFFSLALLVFGIAWNIVWGILLFGFLWALARFLYNLICLALFLYWLFLMFKAYSRDQYMIPYIGELAAKQAGV